MKAIAFQMKVMVGKAQRWAAAASLGMASLSSTFTAYCRATTCHLF